MSLASVLIVDDDSFSRETLADLLSSENCQLETAASGHEALAKARTHRPDLILLDVMMPQMSGYDVCKAVRADEQLAEVPVLLVTALDDPQSRLTGLEAGADDFISKPYDRSELRVRVRTVLKLNRFRRLLAERSKFAWVVDNSREGYVLLNKAGVVNYANRQACHYLHASEVPRGRHFIELTCQHYQRHPADSWNNWPNTGTTDLYLVRPDSQENPGLWLHVESFSSDVDNLQEVAVCLRDVTAQINITHQAWTFHGLISHKLRTPLTGLKAVQLVKKHLEKALPEDKALHQLVGMVEQSANRLETHLMDVLRYIQAPHLSGCPASERIKSRHIANLIKEVANELCVDISIDNQVQTLFALRISATAFKNILHALLDNSKKFHPDKSPSVQVVLTADAQQFTLRFGDDGKRLAPEILSWIWQPYFQGEKNFTGEIRGTGLGLSGVAHTVWSAGGHCRAYNRDDIAGLVIELSMPLAVESL